jgi:hypothetical protein
MQFQVHFADLTCCKDYQQQSEALIVSQYNVPIAHIHMSHIENVCIGYYDLIY